MKNKTQFPDPRLADESGLLCYGGTLTVETLTVAYEQGIFPWPQKDLPMLWFSPVERGILFLNEVHVPKSLKKIEKKFEKNLDLNANANINANYQITVNQNFSEVISQCGKVPRKHEAGTWITEEVRRGYTKLFDAGHAYSVEAWDHHKQLVGGIYGVCFPGFVSAESMFYVKDNASKICLLHLIKSAKKCGFSWLDIQMLTPVTEAMGGRYISRDQFLELLTASQKTEKLLKF